MNYKLPSELTRLLVFARPFIVKKYLSNASIPKFHIGCGPNYKEGWLNADKFDSRADIYLNAYHKQPFKEDTFHYLYSEHTLEHLKITKIEFFLKECLRVLKPGGVFRFSVPDLELLAKKYVERDEAFFEPYLEKYNNLRTKTAKPKYWLVRSYGGIINTLATKHFHHHRWFYDFETIEICCKEVGFSQVIKQSFGQSLVAELGAMDQEKRAHESLYVDLVK